jgi:acetylornithine/succinyldiaminopimelate/putrescine aminotransferase/predicted amino acid dehydrogenase
MNAAEISELTPEAKRALLAELLQNRAAVASPMELADKPKASLAAHPYETYVNPHLGAILRAAGMDKQYVRGEGCYLYDDKGTRYLDFTGAYGALPFGFNPPEICQAVMEVIEVGEPSFIQPSALSAAGELGKRLIEIAPGNLRYVTFTNSGAESVEAAIKLARAATGRRGILSTENSFHGKTLGALSATGRTRYQEAFGAPVPGFTRIPFGDVSALEATLKQHRETLAAFIVEPIQGEGGVVAAPPGYLREARKLCTEYGVLLILDEIQTGLGRTGKLFACDEEGVAPDILTLAKALGGGIVPIGAVLCTADCYTEEFAMKHTSTFANNTLCCRVGLRSLDLILRNRQELVGRVARNGHFLKSGLEELQREFPHLIKSVRGRGYLLGLELTTDSGAFGRQSLMSFMAAQESLVLALCSYMLNIEHIRLAPTLFGARVMRIEPPLTATEGMCRGFLDALRRALVQIDSCNTAQFVGHLVGHAAIPTDAASQRPRRTVARRSADPNEGRWGFVAHPLDLANYMDIDAGLQQFTQAELKELTERLNNCQLNDLDDALVIGSARIVSPKATTYGELLAVPYTAEELMQMSNAEAVNKVRSAVCLAQARGAQIVGLGGYTSIVTQNALALADVEIPLTTGNSYTVVSTLETLETVAQNLGRTLTKMKLAIVGATGSIGRAVSILIGEQAGQVLLAGNPRHAERSRIRLTQVAQEAVLHLANLLQRGVDFPPDSWGSVLRARGLLHAEMTPERAAKCVEMLCGEGRLILTAEQNLPLSDCDIIVTATSNPHHLFTPDALKSGAVLCDISRPSNVSPVLRAARPDVLVLDAGIVELPGKPDIGLEYGLPPGSTYACMAETMLLGLERYFVAGSVGTDLRPAFILELQNLARKHGFHLAALQSAGNTVTAADWARFRR